MCDDIIKIDRSCEPDHRQFADSPTKTKVFHVPTLGRQNAIFIYITSRAPNVFSNNIEALSKYTMVYLKKDVSTAATVIRVIRVPNIKLLEDQKSTASNVKFHKWKL